MSKRVTIKTLAVALAVVFLVALLAWPVRGQVFTFVQRENDVELYINHDGTVRIVYDITLETDADSPALYAVDIGLPNDTYRLGEIQASIDGTPLTDISDSPYVTPGVAVELGPHSIQPGQVGTFHFEAIVRDMIYQDSKDDEYASIEFAPNYFDGELVHGSTRIEVRFHFPPGVGPDEPRYHDREFTDAYVEEGGVVYQWVLEDASPSREYVFGASFPKEYVAEGVVQAAPAFNIDFSACCASPILWIVLFGGGWTLMAVFGARAQKRRKMQYMPPSLAVEGTGIKRGLTAIEAAVLLEAPLDRVMTMILFGLVKKGVLAVESEKPLKVQVLDAEPKDKKLWYYERRFLQAIEESGTLDDKELREMVIDLIGDVNKKVAGFSRQETKAYYKDIAARAWQQVEAADTPEVLGKRWSEGLEWTMLQEDWDDRTREVFHDRPVVVPTWWWLYRPWAAASGMSRPAVPSPAATGGGTPVTLPTLPGGDFANTVVSGIEGAANTVVSSIENFTSGVTQTTNPAPKSSSSSSRGGGYSCACACACAGCACACAGGGR